MKNYEILYLIPFTNGFLSVYHCRDTSIHSAVCQFIDTLGIEYEKYITNIRISA